MIAKCAGCQVEFAMACEYQVEHGWHVAIALDREFVGRGHMYIMLVDDDGKLMVW